jgi:hypothetical protein
MFRFPNFHSLQSGNQRFVLLEHCSNPSLGYLSWRDKKGNWPLGYPRPAIAGHDKISTQAHEIRAQEKAR